MTALGLALMQNKAGKGFNIGRIILIYKNITIISINSKLDNIDDLSN